VFVKLRESVKDRGKEFDDIKLKLDAISGLPEGAGPVNFVKDFGDTAALMLTVASPKASGVEIDLKARDVRAAIERTRAGETNRVSIVSCFPNAIPADVIHRSLLLYWKWAEQSGLAKDIRPLEGANFVGLDGSTTLSDAELAAGTGRFLNEQLRSSELHP